MLEINVRVWLQIAALAAKAVLHVAAQFKDTVKYKWMKEEVKMRENKRFQLVGCPWCAA